MISSSPRTAGAREILRVSRAVEPMDIAVLADNSAAADRAIPSLRDGLKGFRRRAGRPIIKSPSSAWPTARRFSSRLHIESNPARNGDRAPLSRWVRAA